MVDSLRLFPLFPAVTGDMLIRPSYPATGIPHYISIAQIAAYVPSLPLELPTLLSHPLVGPGAGKAVIYMLSNGDGTASLFMQAGTSATPLAIAVNIGSGF